MLPFFGTPVFGEVAEGSGVGTLPPPVKKKPNVIYFICVTLKNGWFISLNTLLYFFYV